MQIQSPSPSSIFADSTAPASSSAASGSAASAASSAASISAPSESMFLQLLVAQMKYQDPTNPQDPTQFVGELAQFSQLEQTIGIKTDTDTIASDLNGVATAPATTNPATTPAP